MAKARDILGLDGRMSLRAVARDAVAIRVQEGAIGERPQGSETITSRSHDGNGATSANGLPSWTAQA